MSREELRKRIRLTNPEVASVCGRFARLQRESKREIGYSILAELSARRQREKALDIFDEVRKDERERIHRSINEYYGRPDVEQGVVGLTQAIRQALKDNSEHTGWHDKNHYSPDCPKCQQD